MKHFLLEISAFCEQHASDETLGEFVGPLAVVAKEWSDADRGCRRSALRTNPDEIGAAAYDYLFYSGYVALAYFWARSVVVAASKPALHEAKLQTARFYFTRILPRVGTHAAAIRAGASTLLDMPDANFG